MAYLPWAKCVICKRVHYMVGPHDKCTCGARIRLPAVVRKAVKASRRVKR